MEKIECLYCPQGLHDMCHPSEDICCCDIAAEMEMKKLASLNLEEDRTSKAPKDPEEKRPVGRPLKTEGFTDLLSTGRKRAAKLYAIQPGKICDWAWKKNCGGGVKPVTGCPGNLAKNIHHGPDKSVLNNSPTNISVVCPGCHNLWHSANDDFYPGERPEDGSEWLPIDPEGKPIKALSDCEDATMADIVLSENKLNRPINAEKIKEHYDRVTNSPDNLTGHAE